MTHYPTQVTWHTLVPLGHTGLQLCIDHSAVVKQLLGLADAGRVLGVNLW